MEFGWCELQVRSDTLDDLLESQTWGFAYKRLNHLIDRRHRNPFSLFWFIHVCFLRQRLG